MKEKKKTETVRLKPGSHPPRYSLGEAVELATAIYENAGGRASFDEFSAITGNTRKSSSFVAKLNVLKGYGLVTAEGDRITLTGLADLIVAPRDPSDRYEGLKEAFLQVETFGLVHEKFIGKILPQGEFLVNTFAQYVPRNTARDWINQFTASADYAGLLLSRGDGKYQVRESGAGMPGPVQPRSVHPPQADTADSVEVPLDRLTAIATAGRPARTEYQMLIEIMDTQMTDDEQAAVWTLIQYLKKRDAGLTRPMTELPEPRAGE